MANPFLDLLGHIGYIADTPGAYLRGALSGQLGERSSGEDLLKSYGVDAGPVGGFAAEAVTDPLALLGLAGGAYKGARAVGKGLGLGSHLDDASLISRLGQAGEAGAGAASRLGPEGYEFLSRPGRGGSVQSLLVNKNAGPAPLRWTSEIDNAPFDLGHWHPAAEGMVELNRPGANAAMNARRVAEKIGKPELIGPTDAVGTIGFSELAPAHRGAGVGQQLYVNAMEQALQGDRPIPWWFSAENSPAASRAIEALRQKGLVDVHWQDAIGGPRIQRLTEAGREAARTQALARAFLDRTRQPVSTALQPLSRAAVGLGV